MTGGYYCASFGTIIAPTAGTAVVAFVCGSVPVRGAVGSVTVTAASQLQTVSVSAIVREFCNAGPALFTVMLFGVDSVVSNAAMNAVKL